MFLYGDKLRMPELGTMGCRRASDVVLDKATQKWKITYLIPGIQGDGKLFETRQEAIDHEIQELEYYMVNAPDVIEAFMGQV